MRLAGVDPRLETGVREAVVHLHPRRGAVGLAALAHRVERLRRVEGDVGAAGVEQLRARRRGSGRPLGLTVRRVRAVVWQARARPFVGREAGPRERVQDVRLGALDEAALVRVLDAEHERAAGLASEQDVVEGRSEAADVEQAGRGRGKRTRTDMGYGYGIRIRN